MGGPNVHSPQDLDISDASDSVLPEESCSAKQCSTPNTITARSSAAAKLNLLSKRVPNHRKATCSSNEGIASANAKCPLPYPYSHSSYMEWNIAQADPRERTLTWVLEHAKLRHGPTLDVEKGLHTRVCYICGDRRHFADRCFKRFRRGRQECFYCRNPGHLAKSCPLQAFTRDKSSYMNDVIPRQKASGEAVRLVTIKKRPLSERKLVLVPEHPSKTHAELAIDQVGPRPSQSQLIARSQGPKSENIDQRRLVNGFSTTDTDKQRLSYPTQRIHMSESIHPSRAQPTISCPGLNMHDEGDAVSRNEVNLLDELCDDMMLQSSKLQTPLRLAV
ncbi:hypothetical protein MMC25_007711 [Agyrium rufum]|nr:hypothetical protein [Agyrium rufum]